MVLTRDIRKGLTYLNAFHQHNKVKKILQVLYSKQTLKKITEQTDSLLGQSHT